MMPEVPEPLISPHLDEVHQQEALERAVPVQVDGPVIVQTLPSRVAVLRTLPVDTSAQIIVGRDLRRSTLVLVTHDQPLWVALTQSAATARQGLMIPIDIRWEIATTEALWVRTESGTSAVGVQVEQWAD